jgi:uncharacterized protein (TIGR02217 family)
MEVYVRQYIKACVAFGWEGGPEFRTSVTEMQNKAEKRNADWSQPRHFFSLPFQNIRHETYLGLREMFMNRMGRWGAFLYYDYLDNTADDEVFAVATLDQTEFQLSKESMVEGIPYRNNVYALFIPDEDNPGSALESTVTIRVNGIVTTAYTLDYDRGKVYFNSPMSGGEQLSWSGGFSRWVRFDQDRLPFSIDNKNQSGFIVNGSVELIEVNTPREILS